jgi:acetyl-CoA acyltransferase 2
VINAAQEIKLGEADVVLTGGAENMSLSPCEWQTLGSTGFRSGTVFGADSIAFRITDTLSGASRFGNKYGVDLKLEDSLAAALTDRVPNPTPSEHNSTPASPSDSRRPQTDF